MGALDGTREALFVVLDLKYLHLVLEVLMNRNKVIKVNIFSIPKATDSELKM